MSQSDILRLPYRYKGPDVRTDSLEDFYIRYREWVNYVGGVLLLSSRCDSLDGDLTFRSPVPTLEVQEGEMETVLGRLPLSLFKTSWIQLSTIYEVYLGELTREVMRLNRELLSVDENQISTSQIFALGSLDKIASHLISRWSYKFGMGSYPNRVAKLGSKFHIGIHSADSPMELFDAHEFIEIRNVLVHTGGHATYSQYHERMRHYKRQLMIERESGTVEINFAWLLGFGERLAELCCFVDGKMRENWNVSNGTA